MELSSKYVTIVGIQPYEFEDKDTKEIVKGYYFHLIKPGHKYMQGFRAEKSKFISLSRVNKYGLPSLGDYISFFYNEYKSIEGWQIEDDEDN